MSSHQALLEVRRRSITAGFYAAGESLAVDLVDTVKLKASPVIDLLDGRHESFWRAHQPLLPSGDAIPDPDETRELRTAIRALMDAALDGRDLDAEAVRRVNAAAEASVPVSLLRETPNGPVVVDSAVGTGNPLLAAVARSAIDSLGRLSELRRCGSPRCSMLYVSASPARLWCSQTCGNRMRVARATRPA